MSPGPTSGKRGGDDNGRLARHVERAHERVALMRGQPTAAMIERGATEVRCALRQLHDGRIEAIQPGSLAEDVLRAAFDA